MLFLLLPLNYLDTFFANFEQLLLRVGSGQIETEILKMFLQYSLVFYYKSQKRIHPSGGGPLEAATQGCFFK